MIRLPNDSPVFGLRPRGERNVWEKRARKALDSWGGRAELSVAVALEGAYRDGLKRAATFLDEKGQREFAMMVRRLAEGTT